MDDEFVVVDDMFVFWVCGGACLNSSFIAVQRTFQYAL